MSDVWVCEWTPYQMLLQGDYLWHNLTSLSQLGSSIKHFYQYVQVGFTTTISLRFLILRCVFPLTMLIYAYFLKFCRFYYSMNSLQIIYQIISIQVKLSRYKRSVIRTKTEIKWTWLITTIYLPVLVIMVPFSSSGLLQRKLPDSCMIL